MIVRALHLKDFRNISEMEISFCETANIIYGDNGQGKTNLLEAIWLFTGAKSFRSVKESEMVRFDQPGAQLSMSFFGSEREQEACLRVGGRREMEVNGIVRRGGAEMAGNFCAVTFSPTHLTLVKSGPKEKRRFIDDAICQMKPKYIHLLAQYTRVLEQRNRLLKDGARYPALYETLDVWDARLANLAAVITKTRITFLARLTPIAAESYGGISKEKEEMGLVYESTVAKDLSVTVPELEKQAVEAFVASRSGDKAAGTTLLGPHRDLLGITLNGKSARLYGSQGQQRSCVLALKMAECRMLYEVIGEYPVVLLDDVMSELDVNRRNYLLNHLEGRQIVITCCDKENFSGLSQGCAMEINAGKIISHQNYEPKKYLEG